MRAFPLIAIAGLASSPALADAINLAPIIDAHLRFEHVEQTPLAKDANALTARVRSGLNKFTIDIKKLWVSLKWAI